MRKLYFSLVALTLMLVSTTAKAQYTAEVTVYPEKSGWYSGEVLFPAGDIATAVGLESADDLAALILNNDQGGNVYLKTTDGKTNTYTGGFNEFWMNNDAVSQAYGAEGSSWYAALRMNEDSTQVRVYMGQMPGFFVDIEEATTLTCQLILANAEKSVTFDVKLNIKPFIQVPFTEEITGLTVAYTDTKDVTVTNGKKGEVEIDLSSFVGLLATQGYTVADVQPVADKMVSVEKASDEAGYPTGKLVQYSTLGALPLSYDSEKKLCYVPNFSEGQSLGSISFDALTVNNLYLSDEGVLSFSVDLTNKEASNNGKVRSFDLYAAYSVFAAKIRVNVTVEEPVITSPDEMTQMGEVNFEFERSADEGFGATREDLDVDAVLAALDLTSADELQLYGIDDNGSFSDNYTAEAPGFWLTQNGIIHAYSGGAFYINYRTNGNYFDIGHMPGLFKGTGDEVCEGSVYFVGDGKYYKVHVKFNIKKEEQVEDKQLVDTKNYVLQMIPATGDWASSGDIATYDLADITEKIGGTPTIYTDHYVLPANDESEGYFEWSKEATLTKENESSRQTINSFWFWKEAHDGYVSSTAWGENANWTFGLLFWNDGNIKGYQRTGNSVGDQYLCRVYFMNDANGKYVQYNFTMKFVEEIDPNANATEVANLAETFEVSPSETYPLNMAAVAEAFGISEEEVGSASILVANGSGDYVPFGATSSYFYFNGNEVTSEPEEGLYPKGTAYVDVDNVDWTLNYEAQDPDNEGVFTPGSGDEAVIKLAFDLETEEGLKRVTYTITIVSEGALVGIDNVKAKAQKGSARYNVAGQQVDKTYKGFYIQGGKTYYAK